MLCHGWCQVWQKWRPLTMCSKANSKAPLTLLTHGDAVCQIWRARSGPPQHHGRAGATDCRAAVRARAYSGRGRVPDRPAGRQLRAASTEQIRLQGPHRAGARHRRVPRMAWAPPRWRASAPLPHIRAVVPAAFCHASCRRAGQLACMHRAAMGRILIIVHAQCECLKSWSMPLALIYRLAWASRELMQHLCASSTVQRAGKRCPSVRWPMRSWASSRLCWWRCRRWHAPCWPSRHEQGLEERRCMCWARLPLISA